MVVLTTLAAEKWNLIIPGNCMDSWNINQGRFFIWMSSEVDGDSGGVLTVIPSGISRCGSGEKLNRATRIEV